LDDGAEEIDEDNKSHTKAAKTTKLLEGNEFDQIVHGRVDPPPALRHKNSPAVRSNCPGMGIKNELGFVF
jgi:hypothetical protein